MQSFFFVIFCFGFGFSSQIVAASVITMALKPLTIRHLNTWSFLSSWSVFLSGAQVIDEAITTTVNSYTVT